MGQYWPPETCCCALLLGYITTTYFVFVSSVLSSANVLAVHLVGGGLPMRGHVEVNYNS